MQNFKVVMSEKAEQDLIDIIEYLNEFSEVIALKYYEHIMQKVFSLSTFPTSCPFVRHTALRKRGFRWTYARNYTIFFIVYEERNLVVVEHILYSRQAYDAIL